MTNKVGGFSSTVKGALTFFGALLVIAAVIAVLGREESRHIHAREKQVHEMEQKYAAELAAQREAERRSRAERLAEVEREQAGRTEAPTFAGIGAEQMPAGAQTK